MENNLPKEWIKKPLKDIAQAVKDRGDVGVAPYLEIGDVNILKNTYQFTKKRSVKGCKQARKNDVLISRVRPTRGAIVRVQEDTLAVSSAFTILRKKDGIDDRYLLHYLARNRSFLNYLGENCTGTMYPTVAEKVILDYDIFLAPEGDQKHIADKLDSLLAKVKDAQSRLDTIPTILNRFRQSVLAAACSGRLTDSWRKGREEVQPYPIKSHFNKNIPINDEEFPMSWQTVRLGDLTTLVTSGSRGWAKYYSDFGSIFIRAQNINSDVLNLDDIAFVKLPNHAKGLRTKVLQYDILVTITGANVTKSALVEKELTDAYVSQHVALVRLSDVRISKFIYYSIISLAHGRKQLREAAYGQGKPGLNLDNIKDVVIGIAPLIEQEEIIGRVQTLFGLADKIEARYQSAKAQTDKLEQSILAKAFRGELVK